MKIVDSIASSNLSFDKALYLFTSASLMPCVLSGAVSGSDGGVGGRIRDTSDSLKMHRGLRQLLHTTAQRTRLMWAILKAILFFRVVILIGGHGIRDPRISKYEFRQCLLLLCNLSRASCSCRKRRMETIHELEKPSICEAHVLQVVKTTQDCPLV